LGGKGIGQTVAGKIQNEIGHAQKAFGKWILFHPAEKLSVWKLHEQVEAALRNVSKTQQAKSLP